MLSDIMQQCIHLKRNNRDHLSDYDNYVSCFQKSLKFKNHKSLSGSRFGTDRHKKMEAMPTTKCHAEWYARR